MEKRHHTALCAANFQPQNINLLFWTLFWKLGKNLNHWMWDRTRCAAFSIVLLTGVCYQSLVVQINQNTNASNQCFHGGYCFLPWLLFSRISPVTPAEVYARSLVSVIVMGNTLSSLFTVSKRLSGGTYQLQLLVLPTMTLSSHDPIFQTSCSLVHCTLMVFRWGCVPKLYLVGWHSNLSDLVFWLFCGVAFLSYLFNFKL